MNDFNNLSDEDAEYVLNLPYHLAAGGLVDNLCELLIEFEFIEYKNFASTPQSLIADYDLTFLPDIEISKAKKDCLKLIQDAIRKSSHIVSETENKIQLAGHLLGRLLSFKLPEIQVLLEQAKQRKNHPWLRPLTPSLTPPGDALIRTFTGHTHYVTAVAISSDRQIAISASNDNTLKVWDLTTNTLRHTLKGHTDRVTTVVITPDGQFAVSGSKDKTLKLWDVVRGTELKTLRGHTSFVNSVAIPSESFANASDAQWVLSGSWGVGNGLCLWDLAENKRYTLAGLQRVNTVAITPDGQIAISGSDDHTLTLWDCSGIPLRILKGHAEAINAVAMTPDGRLAISGSKDKTLKLWDLTNGIELKNLTGHTGAINTVAIAPDGRLAISGSADQTLKVWDIENPCRS